MTDFEDRQAEVADQVRNAWRGPPAAPAPADERPGVGAFGWRKPSSYGAPAEPLSDADRAALLELMGGRRDSRADGSRREVRFSVDEVRADAAPACECDGAGCTCPDGARFTGNIAKCLSNGSCKYVAADEIDLDAEAYARFKTRGEIPAEMTLPEFRVQYGHGPRADADEREDVVGVPDAEDAQERSRSDARDAWRQ